MKNLRNLAGLVLAAGLAAAAQAAPVGEVSAATGKIFDGENYMVVKKDMKKGEVMKPHNHPGFKTLIFAVGDGVFDVTLNQTEKHRVGEGEVLRFDGESYIGAVAEEDASVVITLIK